jgi:hypothetical protein
MLFNLYIFNRLGACVFYEEWNRKKAAANLDDEQNLIYGMLYAFKQFVLKTSPKPELEASGFHYFRTSTYKLHYFETASGFRIVLNSDAATADLRAELKQIYLLLVDFVVKNPLYTPNDAFATDGLFHQNLTAYLTALPCFTST